MEAAAKTRVSGLSSKSPPRPLSVLGDRLLAVHSAFENAKLPHAFGGAIALAYCTQEPRGTRDLDVNVFVEADRSNEVLDALPTGVAITTANRASARKEGQVRVMWEDTPIDIFLNTHDFHREAAKGTVTVPFEGATIPILGCEALVIFKAMFNRTRDWADVEGILEAGTVNAQAVLDQLRELLGESDPAVIRLTGLVSD